MTLNICRLTLKQGITTPSFIVSFLIYFALLVFFETQNLYVSLGQV